MEGELDGLLLTVGAMETEGCIERVGVDVGDLDGKFVGVLVGDTEGFVDGRGDSDGAADGYSHSM
jgi:hypothetical protein